jgi:hypothetical protein
MVKSLSNTNAISFFPNISSYRDREDMLLTPKELSALSKEERKLIELMVDVYRSGSIYGIESYSGGCGIPKDTIKAIIERHETKEKRGHESERFVFAIYAAPSEEEDLFKKHDISLNSAASDGSKELITHISDIAKAVPGSAAFCGSKGSFAGLSEELQFGFTLGAAAAKAMHKVNLSMNPRCRGAGD